MNFSKLSRRPKLFARFTGLTLEEFEELFKTLEKKYPEYEAKRLDRDDRIKAIGQGRKFQLPLKDRVVMLLVYYRLYITHALGEFLFDLDESTVWRNIKKLEPLVKECIPIPEKIHKKVKRVGDLNELEELVPDLKLFLDGTEQEIPRPKNKRRRKSYYSGKKKRHTVKTQILVNKGGLIVHKTKHDKGRVHDSKIFERRKPRLPPPLELSGDLGYEGLQKKFPKLKIKTPIKKPKGKELSKKQKKRNRKLAKERIVVEHVIGRMKQFKIMGGEFRSRLKRYNEMTSIVCGLINFKTMRN